MTSSTLNTSLYCIIPKKKKKLFILLWPNDNILQITIRNVNRCPLLLSYTRLEPKTGYHHCCGGRGTVTSCNLRRGLHFDDMTFKQ